MPHLAEKVNATLKPAREEDAPEVKAERAM